MLMPAFPMGTSSQFNLVVVFPENTCVRLRRLGFRPPPPGETPLGLLFWRIHKCYNTVFPTTAMFPFLTGGNLDSPPPALTLFTHCLNASLLQADLPDHIVAERLAAGYYDQAPTFSPPPPLVDHRVPDLTPAGFVEEPCV